MVLPFAFAVGALIGWLRAKRRGGDRLDRMQYAAAHGILLTIAALVMTVLIRRFAA